MKKTVLNIKTGQAKTVDMTPQDLREIEETDTTQTYAEKRVLEYPPIGDQLDAILKGFNQLRLDGASLPADLDSIVNQWLAVKAKHPKPEASDD